MNIFTRCHDLCKWVGMCSFCRNQSQFECNICYCCAYCKNRYNLAYCADCDSCDPPCSYFDYVGGGDVDG